MFSHKIIIQKRITQGQYDCGKNKQQAWLTFLFPTDTEMAIINIFIGPCFPKRWNNLQRQNRF